MLVRQKILFIIAFLAVSLTLLLAVSGNQRLNAQEQIASSLPDIDIPVLSIESSQVGDVIANCRYGVTTGEETAYVVSDIGAGLFYKFNDPNWNRDPYELTGSNAEVVRMIQTKQEKTASGEYLDGYYTSVPMDSKLASLIRENPGTLWLIGNEIERGPDPGKITTLQGDMFPEVYAEAYHDIYAFIKAADKTARVAIGGVIEPTPMRLQYLDLVWDAYLQKYGKTMPVDVWNVHLYPLSEVKPDGSPNKVASAALGTDLALGKREALSAAECTDSKDDIYCVAEHDDLDIIADHLVAMRQWMKDHGEQQKPLLISEYGVVFPRWIDPNGACYPSDEFGNCFTSERVAPFLQRSFDYLNSARDPELGYALDNDRLAQQWVWFSAFHNAGAFRSNIILNSWSTQLSPVGVAYRDYVFAEPPTVNLVVEKVSAAQVGAAAGDGTFTAKIAVDFRNNGNSAIERPFWVTFFADQNLSQQIGRVRLESTYRGCATQSYHAEVDWTGIPAGTHQFWVMLDSKKEIDETPADNNDNLGSGEFVAGTGAATYHLDITIDGDGGEVIVDPDLARYQAGTKVSLLAVPYEGWTFRGWSGDATGTEPQTDLRMSRDKSVTAQFEETAFNLNVLVKGQGRVKVIPEKEFYQSGEEIKLKAIAADGWYFTGWRGDFKSSSTEITITAESDMSLRATFSETVGEVYLPVHISNP